MKTLLFFFSTALLVAPTGKLTLMEEAIEAILIRMVSEYETNQKFQGTISNTSVVYTGNTTIDAAVDKDSTFYFVYGSYSFDKYTNVNVNLGDLPLGGNQNFNSSGSTTYLAKLKEVFDEYRVQEIIIIDDPDNFNFDSFDFEELKSSNDLFFPEVIYREKERSENNSKDKKDKKKKKDKSE